jgi:hypothetical protein
MATTTTYRTGNYPYRVYTALLTQSGGDDTNTISSGPVTVGVTYEIVVSAAIGFWDFSNVGGPVYPETYTFVATASEEPNSWAGVDDLNYNNGAPVVTVLENTIGNIWFTYNVVGGYSIWSDSLFTENKTTFSIILMGDDLQSGYLCRGIVQEPNSCSIVTGDISAYYDSVLNWKTPIEIRVYN